MRVKDISRCPVKKENVTVYTKEDFALAADNELWAWYLYSELDGCNLITPFILAKLICIAKNKKRSELIEYIVNQGFVKA